MNKIPFCLTALAVAALLVPGVSLGQVQGKIQTTDGSVIEGTFKWLSSKKVFQVTPKGKNVTMELELSKVQAKSIPEPKAFRQAMAAWSAGNAAGAIPLFERIVEEYANLDWDAKALECLVQAYIKNGDAKKALAVCEKSIAANPEAAFKGPVAVSYWRALLKTGRGSKLDEVLTKAIASGDRYSSAFAHLLRGDQILEKSDSKSEQEKALRDGYLRVALMYTDVKEAQPEALYKTYKAFEALGQTGRADTFRNNLKTNYAQSEWARK